MPKYTVEGMFDEDSQVVYDVVVAATEEEAEAKVTAMREAHAEKCGDSWKLLNTTPMAKELAALQKLYDTPDAEVEAGWIELIADIGLKACVVCKKWFGDDDLSDGVCNTCFEKLPDCTDCGNKVPPCKTKVEGAVRHLDCHENCDPRPKCKHCEEHYNEGGDGYDGMCPGCADKTDGDCAGCGKSLNKLEPDNIVRDGEQKFCKLTCQVKYLKKKLCV